VGKIATFRVPRTTSARHRMAHVRHKIKRHLAREMIADLKEEGITRAPKITIALEVI
jgi:hypothetical protein